MTTELTITNDLIIVEPLPLDQQLAAVYIAGLAKGSQRTMQAALDKIAYLLIGVPDSLQVQWRRLRFQHTAAIRSKLAESYSAATANKMLSTLRGVLKSAWRLGQMSRDDYQRAVDIDRIFGRFLT